MTEPFRILVTGSREFADRPAVVRSLSDACALAGGRQTVLRHGGAKGADAIAGSVWASWVAVWPHLHLPAEVYEADWGTYGKRAGSLRNTRMLEDLKEGQKIDVVCSFPLRTSIGTWDMIRKAEAAKIPHHPYNQKAS